MNDAVQSFLHVSQNIPTESKMEVSMRRPRQSQVHVSQAVPRSSPLSWTLDGDKTINQVRRDTFFHLGRQIILSQHLNVEEPQI